MKKTRIALVGIGILSCVFFMNVKAGHVENKQIKHTSMNLNWEHHVAQIYEKLDFGTDVPLSKDVFLKAYQGYLNLHSEHKLSKEKSLLSIVDMNLSANKKRLWVIDLDKVEIIYHSLVSHGQGTGEEYATQFSNIKNSHQSSTGFYITDNPYFGRNGYSLRLHGMDKGFNDNAYDRAIVMHGAPYVSEDFIRKNKRLGRSWGCPAVPSKLAKPIINTIKDQTCLYIHYDDDQYFASTKWLKEEPLIEGKLKIKYLASKEESPNEAIFDSTSYSNELRSAQEVY